jgi:hypothetical protein
MLDLWYSAWQILSRYTVQISTSLPPFLLAAFCESPQYSHFEKCEKYFVNPGKGKIFRTRPDRFSGQPSLPYNGHQDIPEGKAAGPWR